MTSPKSIAPCAMSWRICSRNSAPAAVVISPHGAEWRQACRDLGIADETRCHTLPFPVKKRARRFLYRCSRCGKDFPRVRRIKRAVACLECCRKFNRGKFDPKARLRLVGA